MSSTIPAIEALLNEFYQSATPNVRKREIENELMTFKSQANSWQLSLRVVVAFEQNQFVWFFCTSTLEHTIIRKWSHLTPGDRMLLRETLWNTYANISVNNFPRRQCDTLAQLIALLGKREFPDDHPNYLNHCIELIKKNFPMGVSLLRTTSEEVMSNREDLTTEQKKYFHSCMSLCIPDVMDIVTKYLLIAVCYINGKDIRSIPNNLMDYNLVASLPNDNQLSSSVLELLACVQHLVSWIPTELISEYFLMSILDLSQWRVTHQDITLASLLVLNELFYLQKPLPYAMTLMNGVNGLLEQHNITKQQSEIYVDKFRELLRLYTIKYWPKMINENEILEGFLNSLFYCTISKNGALDFTEKLDIWTPVIRGLIANSKLDRYNDIVHQLIGEIMRRTQFEFNKTELELLDNEIVEDNTPTEWQQFQTQCTECIALVAETRTKVVFNQVFTNWSRPFIYLISIEDDIDNGKHFELARTLKCSSFSEHLRDYATVCQTVVRIVPLLESISTELGAELNTNLQLLSDNLMSTLQFLTSSKIETLDIDKSIFQTDLDYLHAQVLMAIKTVLPLSNALQAEQTLASLFTCLGNILLPGTYVGAPIVHLAASQLLLCVTSVIRPKYLFEMPTVISLMQAGPRLSHLPKQAVANIYISLISYLVLPWKNVDDEQQDFQQRCTVLQEYIECIAQNFLEVDLNAESKVSSITTNLLGTLNLVIQFFKDSSNSTKDVLTITFKPIITKALIIYNNYGVSNIGIAITVAEFSLNILRTIQTQLGSQFVKDLISLFIAVCGRGHLTTNRLAVMEKVLQMFQLIVEVPGNASLLMVPSILDFTIQQILPLLQCDNKIVDNSDISSVLFSLFNSILIYKWQYFYKPYVQHNGSLAHASSDNMHPEHFMSILNAYGHTLVTGTDPNIVRIVLQSMQNVNERCRLYQRPLFKENLLASFQGALINVLLSAEGALNFDLLANSLYAMGQVDTVKLRESFAKAGFPHNLKIIEEICLSTDIPTFSQKLSQLVQDAHCVNLTQT